MGILRAKTPAEFVALKLQNWGWFSNPYTHLSEEELSKLVFYSNDGIASKKKLAKACTESKNLFLQNVEETTKMRVNNQDLHLRLPHTFQNGALYQGEWKANNRHGYGRQIWPCGSYYEGFWESNCAHGKGRFVHPLTSSVLKNKVNSEKLRESNNNGESSIPPEILPTDGDEYVGEWKWNMGWGVGRFISREGSWSYAGQWARNLKDGYGVETMDRKSVYIGEFRQGMRGGAGVLVKPDGTRLSGTWIRNRITGPGRIYGPKGYSLFEGDLLDGARDGLGRLTVGPTVYQGEFNNDAKCGFGEYVWADGRSYLGCWKDDAMHGAGTIMYPGKDGRKVDCALRYGSVIALSLVSTPPPAEIDSMTQS